MFMKRVSRGGGGGCLGSPNTTVEKCTGGCLRRGMVCRKRAKDNEIVYSSWSSPEVKFLVQGFEVAQET